LIDKSALYANNPENLSPAQLGKGSDRLEILLILGEKMDYRPVIHLKIQLVNLDYQPE
jgi:hypothetical protein